MEKISKNDPRFTAKALGEHSEELDALEIAAEDFDQFEETATFAKQLEAELGGETKSDRMDGSQIEALRKSHASNGRRGVLLSIPAWAYSLAACLAIGLFSVVVMNRKAEERSYAFTMPAPADPKAPARSDLAENAPAPAVSLADEKKDMFRVSTKETAPDLESATFETPKIELALSKPAPPALSARGSAESEEVFELSPFTVNAPEDAGYLATGTLAGGRLKTPVNTVGSSTQVVTEELLQYTTSTENAGVLGDFSGTAIAEGKGAFIRPRPPIPPSRIDMSNREGYLPIEENAFRSPLDSPFSTFSIDVDTASYSNMRRMIEGGVKPVPDAIRIEELINYFRYDYVEPAGGAPFSVNLESGAAPWKSEHQLLRVGLKGKTFAAEQRPDANLVFLIDVSGSMGQANKLPLAQASLKLLVEQMGANDRIAIVVYAGSSGLALPSTTANNQETIQHAIDKLRSGGSTNGGAGIELAYKVAAEKFIEGGINRVILCTDGDFNVGVSDDGSLVRLIEEKASSGVFFSAIGFGQGNYQDGKMEQLSNKGNGNYAYIDSKREARKVFVDDMLGTLSAIAKDVKIQVDFNPNKVNAYRLIGYVNRKLAKEDFNDDTKDAGEIGAGHTVTALYEIVPTGVALDTSKVDPSKYQRPAARLDQSDESDEWLTVKLRYKQPDEDESSLLEYPFTGENERSFAEASADFRFAASVAGFGMLLRDSAYKGDLKIDEVIEIARQAKSQDPSGLRSDFIELLRKAKPLLEE